MVFSLWFLDSCNLGKALIVVSDPLEAVDLKLHSWTCYQLFGLAIYCWHGMDLFMFLY